MSSRMPTWLETWFMSWTSYCIDIRAFSFSRGSFFRATPLLALGMVAPRVRASPSRATSAPSDSVKSVCAIDSSARNGLTLSANLGAAVTNATTSSSTYTAQLNAIRTYHALACSWRHQRTLAIGSMKFDEKKKDGSAYVITRAYSGELQHTFYFPSNRYLASVQADFLSNNSLGLFLQQTYGLRLARQQIWDRVRLEFGVGPALAAQHFTTGDRSRTFGAASAAIEFAYQLGADNRSGGPVTFSLSHHTLIPAASGDPTYADAMANLDIPLTPLIGISLNSFVDYLSDTPTGFKKNYLTNTVSLSLKLAPK